MKINKTIWSGIKVIAITVPFFIIFRKIEFSKFTEVLFAIRWWTIPVMLGLLTLSLGMQGLRWWILLRTYSSNLSLPRTMACHFSAAFYSIILPSSAALDIVRTMMISSKIDYSIGWSATWLSRIFGLLSLGILSLYGFLTVSDIPLPVNFRLILSISFFFILSLFFLSFSKKYTRPFRPLLKKFLPLKFFDAIDSIRQGIYLYKNNTPTLLLSFVVSLINQILIMLTVTFTIKGITGILFIHECFAFIPIIEVISLAFPFSPNGMGIRELLTAGFFRIIGLNNEQLGIYVLLLLISNSTKLLGIVPILIGMVKPVKPNAT